jgi:hypothetical protein
MNTNLLDLLSRPRRRRNIWGTVAHMLANMHLYR